MSQKIINDKKIIAALDSGNRNKAIRLLLKNRSISMKDAVQKIDSYIAKHNVNVKPELQTPPGVYCERDKIQKKVSIKVSLRTPQLFVLIPLTFLAAAGIGVNNDRFSNLVFQNIPLVVFFIILLLYSTFRLLGSTNIKKESNILTLSTGIAHFRKTSKIAVNSDSCFSFALNTLGSKNDGITELSVSKYLYVYNPQTDQKLKIGFFLNKYQLRFCKKMLESV